MNNQGEVTTQWADGTYTFRLTVNGIIELEQKCDAPFAVLFSRLMAGEYKYNDVSETIRLGLIGGGMKAVDALKIVTEYGTPIAENVPVARAIVAGAMYGFEASPLGEAMAAPEANQSASTPPSLPEQQTSLESVLTDWDALAFGNFAQR